jgi:Uma2 family endonuclease
VNPALETIRVHRREDDRYGHPAELSVEAGDILTSPLLPGLSVRVSEIFE